MSTESKKFNRDNILIVGEHNKNYMELVGYKTIMNVLKDYYPESFEKCENFY